MTTGTLGVAAYLDFDPATLSGATWAGTFGPDQFSQVSGIDLGGGVWAGVTVRDTGGQTMYLARVSPDVSLWKCVAGTFTQLGATYPLTLLASTDVLRIEAIGNLIIARLNGTVVVSATDSSIPSGGAPGIAFAGQASADNWTGGAPVGMVDSVGRTALRSEPHDAAIATFGDSLIRQKLAPRSAVTIGAAFGEAVTTRLHFSPRTTSTTGLTFGDSVTRKKTAARSAVTSGVTFSDTASKATAFTARSTSTVGLTFGDSVTRRKVAARATSTAGVTFTDVIGRRIVVGRTTSTVGASFSDTASRSAAKARSTSTVGVTFGDSFTRGKKVATRTTSTVGATVTDSVTRRKVAARATVTSGVAFNDFASKVSPGFRAAGDRATSFSDAVTRRKTAGRAALDVGVASFGEALTRAKSAARAVADAAVHFGDLLAIRHKRDVLDAGAAFGDQIGAIHRSPRQASDSGVVFGDVLVSRREVFRTASDVAVFVFFDLVGVGTGVVVKDTGLVFDDSVEIVVVYTPFTAVAPYQAVLVNGRRSSLVTSTGHASALVNGRRDTLLTGSATSAVLLPARFVRPPAPATFGEGTVGAGTFGGGGDAVQLHADQQRYAAAGHSS